VAFRGLSLINLSHVVGVWNDVVLMNPEAWGDEGPSSLS